MKTSIPWPSHIDQQQISVENEHKRQGHGAQLIEERDETSLDRVAP